MYGCGGPRKECVCVRWHWWPLWEGEPAWKRGGRQGEILIKVWNERSRALTPPPLTTHTRTCYLFLTFSIPLSLIHTLAVSSSLSQLDEFSMKGFFINSTSGSLSVPAPSEAHGNLKCVCVFCLYVDTMMFWLGLIINTLFWLFDHEVSHTDTHGWWSCWWERMMDRTEMVR